VSFRDRKKDDKDKDKDDDKDKDKDGNDPTHREKGDASGSKQGSGAKGNKSRAGKKSSPKKHGVKTKSATTISSTRAAYKPHTYFTRANVLWLQAEIDGCNWDALERQANIRGGMTELGA
jgi:hypothetical protein